MKDTPEVNAIRRLTNLIEAYTPTDPLLPRSGFSVRAGNKRRVNYPLYIYYQDPASYVVGTEFLVNPQSLTEEKISNIAKGLAVKATTAISGYYANLHQSEMSKPGTILK
uniref:Uncharacterized protein n=1 Tax=viral metagenome TaxID=1070528 RepID=A0A6M3JPC1_9ZZZZ